MTTENISLPEETGAGTTQAPTDAPAKEQDRELLDKRFWVGLFVCMALLIFGGVGWYFYAEKKHIPLPAFLSLGNKVETPAYTPAALPPQKTQEAPRVAAPKAPPAPAEEKAAPAPRLPAQEPDGIGRYAQELERLLKEKEGELYQTRLEKREAGAAADRLATERDEAVSLALRVHTAYAFLETQSAAKKRGYAENLATFSPEIAEAAAQKGALDTEGALTQRFRALYRDENKRNAYVVSWDFLPEFLQKYARRWLFIEKKNANRWQGAHDALARNDEAALASALRAGKAEGDAEFNAWADAYAAHIYMRRTVKSALERWRGLLASMASNSETTR